MLYHDWAATVVGLGVKAKMLPEWDTMLAMRGVVRKAKGQALAA